MYPFAFESEDGAVAPARKKERVELNTNRRDLIHSSLCGIYSRETSSASMDGEKVLRTVGPQYPTSPFYFPIT